MWAQRVIAEELRLAVRLATCGAVGVTGSLSVPGRFLKTGNALNNNLEVCTVRVAQ